MSERMPVSFSGVCKIPFFQRKLIMPLALQGFSKKMQKLNLTWKHVTACCCDLSFCKTTWIFWDSSLHFSVRFGCQALTMSLFGVIQFQNLHQNFPKFIGIFNFSKIKTKTCWESQLRPGCLRARKAEKLSTEFALNAVHPRVELRNN